MAYSSHISSKAISTSGGRGGGPGSKAPTMYGRVVDVILSLDDPRCTDASKVNGVYYRKLKIATNEEDIDRLEFAPQGNATNRQIPLVGEVVSLVTLPGSDTLQQPEKTQLYWRDIVNVWNHPHHNALPDTKQLEWQSNLLGGVPEKKDINPLQANPGDYLIEGRLGQSIRIGGYKGKNIDFIDAKILFPNELAINTNPLLLQYLTKSLYKSVGDILLFTSTPGILFIPNLNDETYLVI